MTWTSEHALLRIQNLENDLSISQAALATIAEKAQFALDHPKMARDMLIQILETAGQEMESGADSISDIKTIAKSAFKSAKDPYIVYSKIDMAIREAFNEIKE